MTADKLRFFRVSDDYINFLKTIDPRILNNSNENRARPYVGVILIIGIFQYYAPISSYKPEKHDKIRNNSVIKINGKDQTEKLAVLHINNMFPIIPTEIEEMDFSKEERHYERLLQKEYSYIIRNQEDIQQKARKWYEDVIKGGNFPAKISCDYKQLEKEYINFKK